MNPPATSTEPVIAMRGVAVGALRDPGVTVASDVNWRVAAGDFWAVAGLHGAGKSDFLMLTGGVMAPLRGDYTFLGEPMPIFADDRLPHRLKLGLVFDGARLFNRLSLAENVALPLRYHRDWSPEESASEVGALLELLELTPFAALTPASVGRNWQRRAALARALALRPEVLLLDNPLAGLDLRQQNWWLQFLAALNAGHPLYGGRRVTLIVTTGGFREWRDHARQFALLDQREFTPLGAWPDLERSSLPLVREFANAAANV